MNTKREVWFFLIMLLSMIIWGGSWTSSKLISDKTSTEVLIFYRFFITFLSFIPIIIIQRKTIKIKTKGFINITLGAIILLIYNVFFFSGLKVGLAGSGGVIVTTLNPLFTFLIAFFIFKVRIGKKELIGVFLGIIGGVLLMEVWKKSNLFIGGNIFFLLAALSWSLLSLLSQRSKNEMSPYVFSFYIYGVSSLINFFIALPKGILDVFSLDFSFWINMLYISLGATTFATTAYFYAATKLGASKASSYTFLVPASALLFSWLILKEQPSLITLIGGFIALIAVYIINYRPKKPLETKNL